MATLRPGSAVSSPATFLGCSSCPTHEPGLPSLSSPAATHTPPPPSHRVTCTPTLVGTANHTQSYCHQPTRICAKVAPASMLVEDGDKLSEKMEGSQDGAPERSCRLPASGRQVGLPPRPGLGMQDPDQGLALFWAKGTPNVPALEESAVAKEGKASPGCCYILLRCAPHYKGQISPHFPSNLRTKQ